VYVVGGWGYGLDASVQQRYIKYLTWWAKRVMARNNFSLTFEVNIWKKKEKRQWIELEGNP